MVDNRGYYRCSSFRGCPARKQVERDRADPGQLIITYTAEHNHPAPPRPKLPPTPPPTAAACVSDSALAAAAQGNCSKQQTAQPPSSPVTSDGDEEGVLMVEDMEMMGKHELFFVGDMVETAEAASSWLHDDDGGFEDRSSSSVTYGCSLLMMMD